MKSSGQTKPELESTQASTTTNFQENTEAACYIILRGCGPQNSRPRSAAGRTSSVNKSVPQEEKEDGCGTHTSEGAQGKHQPPAQRGYYSDPRSNRLKKKKNYDTPETTGNLDTNCVCDDIKKWFLFLSVIMVTWSRALFVCF